MTGAGLGGFTVRLKRLRAKSSPTPNWLLLVRRTRHGAEPAGRDAAQPGGSRSPPAHRAGRAAPL